MGGAVHAAGAVAAEAAGFRLTLLRLFTLALVIFCFFVAINLMGAALTGLSRSTLQELVDCAVASPLSGLFLGVAVTALIQSSSVTTSVAVGMVVAGTISVDRAVFIVMGANIGTTVTNVLVSLVYLRHRLEFRRAFAAATVHDFFNVLSVIVLLPLELQFGLIQRTAVWLKAHVIHDSLGKLPGARVLVKPLVDHLNSGLGGRYLALVVSLLALVACLVLMVRIIRALVLTRMARLIDRFLFKTTAHALLLGLVITMVVQSSSVSTSLVVPLAGAGLLTVQQVYPYTLGANVGTTVTAFLAASAAASTGVGPAAQLGVVVALMHLVFNLLGIAIFLPLKRIPIAMANACAEYVTTSRRRTVLTLTGVGAGLVFLILVTFW